MSFNIFASFRGAETELTLARAMAMLRHALRARSFSLAPYLTFMPVYAKDILKGGPDTLGMLMAASGFGALFAALYLANRKSVVGLGDRVVAGCFATAVAAGAFAYNHVIWAAFPLLVISGCGTIIVVTSCNILLQSLARLPQFEGRNYGTSMG